MEEQDYIYVSNSFSRYGASWLAAIGRKGTGPRCVIGLNQKSSKSQGGSIFAKFTVDEILRYASLILLRKNSLLPAKVASQYFLADAAKLQGIPYVEVATLNADSTRALIEEQAAQAVLVCSLSQIIGKKTLALLPIYNLHPGGLPENRGANPIERSVLLGHEYVAASLHRMTAKVDQGEVYSRSERDIKACFCWSCVMKSAIEAGTEAIEMFLGAWRTQSLNAKSQADGAAYYPKVTLGEKYLARIKLGYRFVYRRFTA